VRVEGWAGTRVALAPSASDEMKEGNVGLVPGASVLLATRDKLVVRVYHLELKTLVLPLYLLGGPRSKLSGA